MFKARQDEGHGEVIEVTLRDLHSFNAQRRGAPTRLRKKKRPKETIPDHCCIAEIGVLDIAKRLEDGQNMKLDMSPLAMDCIAEKGFDIRYGARPLKRTLARELLNPLSRLVLEGSVVDGDNVLVRTRGEAERDKETSGHGWISSNPASEDKNDVVIIRNHEVKPPSEPTWDDDEFLLDDGTHEHR